LSADPPLPFSSLSLWRKRFRELARNGCSRRKRDFFLLSFILLGRAHCGRTGVIWYRAGAFFLKTLAAERTGGKRPWPNPRGLFSLLSFADAGVERGEVGESDREPTDDALHPFLSSCAVSIGILIGSDKSHYEG